MFLSFILFLEKNKISVFAATEIHGVGVGDVFKLNSVYKAWQYYSFSFYDNDGNYLSNISGSAYNESDDIFTIDNDFLIIGLFMIFFIHLQIYFMYI